MPRIRSSVAALAAIAAGSALAAAPAVAAPVQVPFTLSGGPQHWTVPEGVTEATFTLQGGAGGAAATGGAGGVGAAVRATLAVTPGERLTIIVGGQPTLLAPGFNGGGDAGTGGIGPAAGAGGGATTILSSSGANLLVAAGGGGGGANGAGGPSAGAGGDGGAGGAAGAAGTASGVLTAGGGGQPDGAGGAAGAGDIAGEPGETATTATGGAGATLTVASAGGNGGGGGGGVVGGGGGGAGGSDDGPPAIGAGGGGGAGGQSFVTASATNSSISTAAQHGDGVAVISYEPLDVPAAITQPTLSGVAQVGRALTCELGTWSGSPSLAVAWLRDGAPIAGAGNATHTLVAEDAGKQIACQVTATNSAGTTIARSPAITVPLGTGPINATAPTIRGTSAIGERLTCETGTWVGTPTFAYVWLRNGRAIAGQTREAYTLVRADAGQSIQCAVTATIGGESVTATTAMVGGPARLVILSTTALVSRTGAVTVKVACFGPTDCVIPRMTATSGQVIARGGARTVRSGNSSRYRINLGRRGLTKLRRTASSIPVRFVSAPNGGYGGNARISFVALRGTTG
ncbi:hypothetical protein [Conexibacter arvalis]|uniref:Ig-like domain-containing protein n=1 Tax=Conexibacter arvalis TaxID=912552 RepID=A0A840ICX1_9ACTN|nr:hypothetical protein [Conexibacter arvalis]MBB4662091.1 hypothetical protein [Conexibacter arvalis]